MELHVARRTRQLVSEDRPTILQAVQDKVGAANVTYVPGTPFDNEIDLAKAALPDADHDGIGLRRCPRTLFGLYGGHGPRSPDEWSSLFIAIALWRGPWALASIVRFQAYRKI